MRLDAQVLRYLTNEEFRVLTAIEMGQRNHDLVPTALICRIAGLKGGVGAAFKLIQTLHRNKLIYHECQVYDGYRLTYLGYDYLALKTYVSRGLISGLGRRIGVGKEADIYTCVNAQGQQLILKLHRLGRISFRQIKNKRDYLQGRTSASWMYMSRLGAVREYAYMKALYDHGFPVPTPYDHNRHTILMSQVDGVPFGNVRELKHPSKVYSTLMNMIVRLAEHGLIHCDFNEFNLMINEDEKITLLDFPQMVSTSHKDAEYYFDRDVQCIVTFFKKRFGYDNAEFPHFFTDTEKMIDLDTELQASGHGFTAEQEREFNRFIVGKTDAEQQAHGDDEENDDAVQDDEEEEDVGAAPSLDEFQSSAANDEEAEKLSRELAEQERNEENYRTKSAKASSKQSKKKQEEEEQEESEEEEESDEEDEDEDEDEKRRLRMARKDARQAAERNKQQMRAKRREMEKQKKSAPPDNNTNTTSSSSNQDNKQDQSQQQTNANDNDNNFDDDDDVSDDSSKPAPLPYKLPTSILNIQLPSTRSRIKPSNRNKDRARKKIHAVIKEHL